ncbi:uncharacterized protein LOC133339730 isoform X1 [Lethenteron reissneri]|uniref:uncharacterized protein LOC133339730 isoform X1 n=1 Tax=Lethenteron reissneri TaxID=7753 RepID=UPI002AB75FCB|nr:uncharacterized protein LOC133339730 isoform X1 [Lethenteron reissneri]
MDWLVLFALPLLTLAQQGCDIQSQKTAPLRSIAGETVILPCHARSPLCIFQIIMWFKITARFDSKQILKRDRTKRVVTQAAYRGRARLAWSQPHDASLILTDVSPSDSGVYECRHFWTHGYVYWNSVDTVTMEVTKRKTTSATTTTATTTTTTTVTTDGRASGKTTGDTVSSTATEDDGPTVEMTTNASCHVISGAAAAHVTAVMLLEVVVVAVVVVVVAVVVIVLLICHFRRKGRTSTHDVSPPENEYEELRQREIVYDHLERDRKAARGATSPPLGPTI